MELRQLPFPVLQKGTPVLTPDEKKKIVMALAEGWKRYCAEEIYYSTEHALALIRQAGVHRQWMTMSASERKAVLAGTNVEDDLVADGWPLHGLLAKLAKYRSQPARLVYAVLTADLSSARKAEILNATYILIDLDEKLLRRCQSIPGEVDSLMMSDLPPQTAKDLIAALDIPLNAAFFVAQYARVKTGMDNPQWDDFVTTYASDMMTP